MNSRDTMFMAASSVRSTENFASKTRSVPLERLSNGRPVQLLLSAVLIPKTFGKFWMKLAGVLGFINTRILLGLAFYVLFTPWAIIMKLTGKDPLRRSKTDGSYWIPRTKPRAHDHFERLF